jgi:putative ABC transport system substrate-binding protein
MKLVLVVVLISSGVFIGSASADKRDSPIQIGVLTASWGPTPQVVGLRDGLVTLGYREHEQFVIGIRFTQGDIAVLPAVARELVAYGVDVIIADGDASAKAAQQATSKIPIVFASVSHPVKLGLVRSFAWPGGNITGVTELDLDLSAKRLQLFQEMIPGMKRVLFPYDPSDAYAVAAVKVYRDAARRLGIALVEQRIRTEEEAKAFLAQGRQEGIDGILGQRCCALNLPGLILKATSAWRIPTIFSTTFFAERGALASYGPDNYETGRQAARLVDKILKGANPADIPVETNSKIEFVINLETAQALGLTIAPDVLFQANKVVRQAR